jgi:hypothetical protein
MPSIVARMFAGTILARHRNTPIRGRGQYGVMEWMNFFYLLFFFKQRIDDELGIGAVYGSR